MQNNVGAHFQTHEDRKSALLSFLRVPGLKQAEQVGVLTGFFILLVDSSSE